MLRVGFIGWRGMVGSVLMQRMREENDFAGIEPVFFSTSAVGGTAPKEAGGRGSLKDAKDLQTLSTCDVLISCQGGDYTTEIYAPLRNQGWKGYWIDAASTLRMSDEAVIVLDPVNETVIRDGLARGLRTFAGGNCTVSLMLMAVSGLLKSGLVEWITTMTYQAASGAGAAKVLELVKQMECITDPTRAKPSDNALEVDRMVTKAQRCPGLPTSEFGAPLAASLIPWVIEGCRMVKPAKNGKAWPKPIKSWPSSRRFPLMAFASALQPCDATARRFASNSRRRAASGHRRSSSEWQSVGPTNSQ